MFVRDDRVTGELSRVTAVVVSYNTIEALQQCLGTLTAAEAQELQVVVVDNASGDGSPQMVSAGFPSVRLIESSANLGFGAAANLGAGHAKRDLLLILNPDCRAPAAAVRELASRLLSDPTIGFAGPQIRLASGVVDHASLRGDPDPTGAFLYFTRIARLFPKSPRVNRYSLRHLDYGQEQELPAGTAACLMIRTAAFREVGGFDEEFFMYGEDLDLCRRLREAGHGGAYVPAAEVIHLKGEATRKASGRMLREFHRSMWTYYRKHEAGRHSPVYNGLVRLGITGLMTARLGFNALRQEKRVSAR
jgi:GT2 family glycosyltransferase